MIADLPSPWNVLVPPMAAAAVFAANGGAMVVPPAVKENATRRHIEKMNAARRGEAP
jgi:inosine-uridine nucleoside N-ribohydrolase